MSHGVNGPASDGRTACRLPHNGKPNRTAPRGRRREAWRRDARCAKVTPGQPHARPASECSDQSTGAICRGGGAGSISVVGRGGRRRCHRPEIQRRRRRDRRLLHPIRPPRRRLFLRPAMRIHLVNPSDVSFGTAVITPRWQYVAGRGDAGALRHAACSSTRRSSRSITTPIRPATSSASASTRATRCAATRSARLRARAARPSCSAAFTRRCSPTKSREHGGAHAVVTGDGDLRLADGARRLRRRQPRSRSTTADASTATRSSRRDGICCRATGTCGRRCRRCAAARSTARSARCGAPTARSRASATSNLVVREIVELRRAGFRFIVLADDNFYPVTLADLAQADRRSDTSAATRR